MRMNISVPDDLANEVRKHDLPISAICQRALREEVNRLHVIENTDDILVYVESDYQDPDPASWPGWDGSKPNLIYQRYPIGGRWELGWLLTYDLAPGSPDEVFTPGDPDDPPVEWARHVVRIGREEYARELEDTDDTEESEELAQLAEVTGDRNLTHLVQHQNRMAADIYRLLASANRQARQVAGLRDLIERMEKRQQERSPGN